jgi:hypothetical protein
MTIYDVVRKYVSPDGNRAVTFEVGDHGLVRYSLLEWRKPDPDNPYEVKGYWLPIRESGIYETVNDAVRDAARELDWFKGAREAGVP